MAARHRRTIGDLFAPLMQPAETLAHAAIGVRNASTPMRLLFWLFGVISWLRFAPRRTYFAVGLTNQRLLVVELVNSWSLEIANVYENQHGELEDGPVAFDDDPGLPGLRVKAFVVERPIDFESPLLADNKSRARAIGAALASAALASQAAASPGASLAAIPFEPLRYVQRRVLIATAAIAAIGAFFWFVPFHEIFGAGLGQLCDSDNDCRSDWCRFGASSGICTRKCSVDSECGDLRCLPFSDASRACSPVPTLALGEPCHESWQCRSSLCNAIRERPAVCARPCKDDSACGATSACLRGSCVARDAFERAEDRSACGRGDPNGCYNLALAHLVRERSDDGEPELPEDLRQQIDDPAGAAVFLDKACKLKSAPACRELARLRAADDEDGSAAD